jgi:DNA-binding transcriptional regulator LsrR (DeoR family)
MPKYFDSENDELAFAAAVLSHGEEELTQEEIRERLGLNSTMQVFRLLQVARQKGFIKRPVLEAPVNFELGAKLQQHLPNLRRVTVAYTHEELKDRDRIHATAIVAAHLWQSELRNLPPNSRVGIGGGRGIASTVDQVVLPDSCDLEFLSIANIPFGDWEVSADTNVAVLKRRFSGVKIRPLGAMKYDPDMTDSQIEKERQRLLGLKTVRQHMEDFKKCQMVFSGIGSFEDKRTNQLIREMHFPGRIPEKLVKGDMSYNLIYHDREVFHKDCPMRKRLISVAMDDLKDIASRSGHLVVGVAWGTLKAKPVLDAYRAGVVNALAIELQLAKEMLKLIGQGYHEVNNL